MKFDVVTFGSATYDIYLSSKEFELKKTNEGVMLCQMYGAKVLVDACVVVTGGGATNAAVCFERMGLQSGIVACLGRDHWGSLVRAKLAEEGVSLIHLQSTTKKPTSSSVVLVGKDGGRTLMVYRAASNLLSWRKVDWQRLDARWLYVSSLGGDFNLLTKIIRLCREKDIKLAFNPGSQELERNKELKQALHYVDVLLFNKQEALMLLGKTDGQTLKDEEMFGLGAKLVVVTEGRKGATVYDSQGKKYKQKVIEAETVEETGAGDAFGSGFVAAQIHNLSIEQSLLVAATNAAHVVEHIGPKEGLMFWPEVKAML